MLLTFLFIYYITYLLYTVSHQFLISTGQIRNFIILSYFHRYKRILSLFNLPLKFLANKWNAIT